MQIIPKLTRQRIAELPEGTPIRIGSLVVTFNGCSIEPDIRGNNETFIHYIDENGQHRRYSDWVITQSATEFTDSAMCDYCGRFRHPSDIVEKPIRFWNRSEMKVFCDDSKCAELYQQSIRVPVSRAGKSRRRAS